MEKKARLSAQEKDRILSFKKANCSITDMEGITGAQVGRMGCVSTEVMATSVI